MYAGTVANGADDQNDDGDVALYHADKFWWWSCLMYGAASWSSLAATATYDDDVENDSCYKLQLMIMHLVSWL